MGHYLLLWLIMYVLSGNCASEWNVVSGSRRLLSTLPWNHLHCNILIIHFWGSSLYRSNVGLCFWTCYFEESLCIMKLLGLPLIWCKYYQVFIWLVDIWRISFCPMIMWRHYILRKFCVKLWHILFEVCLKIFIYRYYLFTAILRVISQPESIVSCPLTHLLS